MSLSAHEELLLLRKRARRRLVGATFLVFVATAVLWNVLGALPEQEMRPEKVEITGLPLASAPLPVAPVVPAAPLAAAASEPQVTDILATLPPEDAVLPTPGASAGHAVPPVPAVVPAPKPPAPVVKEAVAPAPLSKPEPKPKAVEAPKPPPVKEPPAKVVKAKPEELKPKIEDAKSRPDPMAILEGREEKAAKAAAASAEGSQFNIQLAALSDPEKVDALRAKLAAAGVSAHFGKVQTSKGDMTRVRIGPFADRSAADAALRKLARAGVTGVIVAK